MGKSADAAQVIFVGLANGIKDVAKRAFKHKSAGTEPPPSTLPLRRYSESVNLSADTSPDSLLIRVLIGSLAAP